ncbi:LmrA/YxaF family transcription factor [Streptomyces sp. PTD5-9]|uniref:LmrA/YxaF family transcription factor n=1 Tax=Streptomyces sp. PTD5-9 TaxID=3120150 RepID=UPI003FCE5736
MDRRLPGRDARLGRRQRCGQDATALATMVVAAYEGATLLARVRRSVAPLQTVSAQLEILIRAALNEAAAAY